MDFLATTITSLAIELTLEFISGACLHKSVELACLHQVWGVCLHTSKIQFILKLRKFCCYFFCNHFRVQWALFAIES